MGQFAWATAVGTTAVGRDSYAYAQNATALGLSAWANGVNSVALGAGARAPEANVVSIGNGTGAGGYPATRRITNLAAGINATDAVNMAQLQEVADVAEETGRYFKASGDGEAFVNGQDAVAAGSDAMADGDYATAAGASSSAYGEGASAFGSGATANGANAVAVGMNSSAGADGNPRAQVAPSVVTTDLTDGTIGLSLRPFQVATLRLGRTR